MKMEQGTQQVERLEPTLERRLAVLEADVWLAINYMRIVAEQMGLKRKVREIEERYQAMRAEIEADQMIRDLESAEEKSDERG